MLNIAKNVKRTVYARLKIHAVPVCRGSHVIRTNASSVLKPLESTVSVLAAVHARREQSSHALIAQLYPTSTHSCFRVDAFSVRAVFRWIPTASARNAAQVTTKPTTCAIPVTLVARHAPTPPTVSPVLMGTTGRSTMAGYAHNVPMVVLPVCSPAVACLACSRITSIMITVCSVPQIVFSAMTARHVPVARQAS